jgi:hypothetical protein
VFFDLSSKSKNCDNSKELPQQFSCTVISRTNKADEKGFCRRISRMSLLCSDALYETTSKQVFRLASYTPNKNGERFYVTPSRFPNDRLSPIDIKPLIHTAAVTV